MRSVTGFGYAMNIYVGASKSRTKQINLPYEGMFVQPVHVPRNPKKNIWRNMRFQTQVLGKTLAVTREDSGRGWSIPLVFKAFYSKDVLHTHERALDMHIQNEGSVLTVKLRPGQKIRCAPKTLIFKEEEVKKMNVMVLPVQTNGLGKLSESLRQLNNIKQSFSGDDEDDDKMTEYSYTNEETITSSEDGDTENEEKSFSIVTLGVQFPSKIQHLSLGEYGNRIIFREGTLLAASEDVEVFDTDFLDSFQSLVGHGEVFLQIGPTLKRMVLKEDESVAVRQDCLIAFTQDVKSSMQKMDKLKGIFDNKVAPYRKLTGPGILWVDFRQSNILVESIEDEEISIAKDPEDEFDPHNDTSDLSIMSQEREVNSNDIQEKEEYGKRKN